MKDVVIVGALRTPIGCFRGALAGHSAVELGSLVVKALLERTGVAAHAVDEVILGQVLTAGAGQNPARQSAIKGGLPNSVSAITINDVCGSGLKALHLATQAIQCGEADIVIAGGQENMSRAPHVLTDSRTGAHLGDSQLVDSLVHDGLWDAFNDYHIGVTAENLAREYGISRQLQDAYALSSQQKARAAIDAGRFKDEIVPVRTQNNGQIRVVDTDEQPRADASVEGLACLDPSFDSHGSVTAGNASSINDGAAAVMMMSEVKARTLNLPVLARIRAFASVGVDPALMGIAPYMRLVVVWNVRVGNWPMSILLKLTKLLPRRRFPSVKCSSGMSAGLMSMVAPLLSVIQLALLAAVFWFLWFMKW